MTRLGHHINILFNSNLVSLINLVYLFDMKHYYHYVVPVVVKTCFSPENQGRRKKNLNNVIST